jgi:hypothetical protein
VDVEDLFYMLKQQPIIKEKENAIDYEFKGGNIELRNVSFKHPVMATPPPKGKKGEAAPKIQVE